MILAAHGRLSHFARHTLPYDPIPKVSSLNSWILLNPMERGGVSCCAIDTEKSLKQQVNRNTALLKIQRADIFNDYLYSSEKKISWTL
jgi:hypothetical protein